MDSIQQAMVELNKFPQYGSIKVMEHEPDYFDGVDVLDGDVVVFCDFMTDDCQSKSEEDQLVDWYCSTLYGDIDKAMSSLGYELITDNDGSGGGLYYGGALYRKI